MPKIILIGPAHPLRGGGMATFNEKLAEELQNDGHDVEIITFKLQYPRILFPGKTQLSDELPPKNLRISVLLNSINPYNWYKTAQYIQKQNPDTIIIRYWMPFMAPCLGTLARLLRQKTQARLICIADNITPHEFFPFSRLLTRYFIAPIHKFVVMSQSVANDLHKHNATKPVVCLKHPLYSNFGEKMDRTAALKHLGLSEKYRYVLFFGFIRAYKGLDLLLNAFAHPMLRQSNIRLIVAGEFYEKSSPYFEIIAQKKLQNAVVPYHHFIPNEEVKYFFCAADMVAQPYKHATQSGVTQIAYHFDVPMLVTDVGGLAELVPHKQVGYVVQPDSTQIAEAIHSFFENDEKNAFANNAKAFKSQFSWQIFIKNLLA